MAWMIRRDYSQSTSTNSDLLASVYLILMLGGMILPSTSLCVVTFSCMSLATLTARRTLPATRRASPLFQHCFSMIFPWPKKWKSMTYRHWLKVQERIEYKIISTTYKVLQSSSPQYLRDYHPAFPIHSVVVTGHSFTHKLSRVSKSLTVLFGMLHLTYGTNFLRRFAFLVSRPPQSALLHCQAPTLLLNGRLACLTGSSILVLKLTFSADPFPRNLPLSLTDWFHGFYPASIRKSLALKILVSAAD